MHMQIFGGLFMNSQCIRLYSLVVTLVFGLTLTTVPAAMANERHLTCGSKNYGYKYCRIYTGGRVRLVHQMSSRPCDEGETWGYDGQGVWVDKGCRADFIVDEAYGGWDDGYGRKYDSRHHSSHHHKDHSNVGAALGVAAGAAILGALFSSAGGNSSANTNTSYNQRNMATTAVPSWAIGTFQGYDQRHNSDIELTITPSGQVYGDENGRKVNGSFNDQMLEINRTRYTIKPNRNGLIATREGDYHNQIHYVRIR